MSANNYHHALCPVRNDQWCMGKACAVAVPVLDGWVCGLASHGDTRRIVEVNPYGPVSPENVTWDGFSPLYDGHEF